MECPICNSIKTGYVIFKCNHGMCTQCLLKNLNQKRETCPLCRANIIDSVPAEILAEVQVAEDNAGYESTDEIDEEASHLKIRCGSREIAFIRNDGKRREIFYEDGNLKFRIEYRNRRCYLFRADDPTPISLHPLRAVCAISRVNSTETPINVL